MKFNIPKILMALISVNLIIILSSCSLSNESTLNNKSVLKIGIVQVVEHPALNTIRDAFIKQLDEKGFKDGKNITIDYQNAQGDQSNLKSICQKFTNSNYDLIVAIATPSAQAAASETKNIPILFAACTDPIAAGLVENLDKPGRNITGTSDVISANKIMQLAKRITPEIQEVGVLYSTNETSSVLIVNELKNYVKNHNINIIEATVTNTSEVNQAILFLVDKVDAIFIPIDNIIATSMPLVAQIATRSKKPVFVGADSLVKDGGLAACGINYTILGKETADMAVEILNGRKAGDIPVKIMKDLNIYINRDTAQKIGITIPDNVLKEATEIF